MLPIEPSLTVGLLPLRRTSLPPILQSRAIQFKMRRFKGVAFDYD